MTSDAPILAPLAAAREQSDPRRWTALFVLLLAAFMSLLDVSIAIPSIQRGLPAAGPAPGAAPGLTTSAPLNHRKDTTS